jgi:autotransporter-associated beta strand protein
MGGISDTVASINGVTLTQPGSSLLTGTLTVSNGFAVSSNSGTATVSTVVAGATGLTKSGSGTLRLTGSNSYSGVTSISGGMVL